MKTKTKPARKSSTKAAPQKPAKSSTTKEPATGKSADTGTPAAAIEAIKIRKEEIELPLAAIVPSPENRTITPDSLDTEFVDSIRTWGIQARLWVYPLAADDKRRKKGATHELIAGERRWCGAGLVGLKTAPVVVYHCTTQQADELRIMENLQRQNPAAIEEGRAFLRLVDKHGFAVRDDKHPARSLFHTLNKSESYIFGRIKLVQAPRIVVEALEAGKLTPSVALRVARIADPKAQVECVAEIHRRSSWGSSHALMTDDSAAKLIEIAYLEAELLSWKELQVKYAQANLFNDYFQACDQVAAIAATIAAKRREVGACSKCGHVEVKPSPTNDEMRDRPGSGTPTKPQASKPQ